MAAIFDKVIAAANQLLGGSGDYTITNDFFSYRAPGVVQFAARGIYHTDCDFWKIDASDGFNLWILVDHNNLSTSFDVLEKHRNQAVYQSYDGKRALFLIAKDGSDPTTSFRPRLSAPIMSRMGHSDVLNWRSNLHVAFRQLKQMRAGNQAQKRPQLFSTPSPINSHIELALGEALVLREQELHRTDLHTPLIPGQYRLVAGFKLQRRNATISNFNLECTAQQDRFNTPQLWEEVGKPLQAVYTTPPGATLVHLDFSGKVVALLIANCCTFAFLILACTGALYAGSPALPTVSVAACAGVAVLVLVVVTQFGWLMAGAESLAGEGGRLRSAIK